MTASPIKAANQSRYDPGHPWYYLSRERGGDGQEPWTVAQIIADVEHDYSPQELDQYFTCYPIRKTGTNTLQTQLENAEAEFERDKAKYTELLKKRIKAVSQYDIEVCNAGDEEMALAVDFSLCHNHVYNTYRRLSMLRSLRRGGIQQTLDLRV